MKNILLILILISVVLSSFADTLQNIMQQKKIYIGTTGDYQPLTWFNAKTQQYQGSDIELIKKFAHYLKAEPIFVKTTWPTLSADLKAKKFDVALGGISIIPSREQEFIFSRPLQYDNKVALMRCTDLTKYRTLAAINQPNVRVIENKGGANEQFAKQNLQHAKLMLVANNPTIFAAILNQKADVMITDNIEARYQQKNHPKLCLITLDKKIAPTVPKAIMLKKEDFALQEKINQWLNH